MYFLLCETLNNYSMYWKHRGQNNKILAGGAHLIINIQCLVIISNGKENNSEYTDENK